MTGQRLRELGALLLVAAIGLAFWWGMVDDDGPGTASETPNSSASADPSTGSSQEPIPPPSSEPTRSAPRRTRPSPPKPERPEVRQVIAISVDGLASRALVRLGPDATPSFTRLMSEGESTLNARTEVEQTVTLPNHAGMLTGRRVDAAQGGHGVVVDDDTGTTVQALAGGQVRSVYDVVHGAGGSTALFATKEKLALFDRSWPEGIDDFETDLDAGALMASAVDDVLTERRAFTLIHLGLPDEAGHATGWMSPTYLASVRRVDALIGSLLTSLDEHPRIARTTALVVTSDHGGVGSGHRDATDPRDYVVPFYVRGPGVAHGTDFYDVERELADPGTAQPPYDAARPPVRNGDLANVVTDLLGLGPVPGSELDADQSLLR